MWVRRVEDGVAITVLAAMVLLALLEVGGRALLGVGVAGSIVLVQHLTLWTAVLGAVLAARSHQLLALSTPRLLPDWCRVRVHVATSAMAVGVCAWLFVAGMDLVRIERQSGGLVAWGIPSWAAFAILPLGFALIAVRLVRQAGTCGRHRVLAPLDSPSLPRSC